VNANDAEPEGWVEPFAGPEVIDTVGAAGVGVVCVGVV
jgi:hypothetical protein